MDIFSALNDSDDEEVKVKGSKAGTSKVSGKSTAGTAKENPRARGAAKGGAKNKERASGRAVKVKGDGEPRQRQYDRRDGSGRGNQVGSKDGHKGWGNEKHDAANAEKLGVVDEAAQGAADALADLNVGGNEPEEPAEPAKPVFTVDEWLAKKAESTTNSELFGAVQARTVNKSDYSGIKTQEDPGEFVSCTYSKPVRAKGIEKGTQRSLTKKTAPVSFKLAKEDNITTDRRPQRDNRNDAGRNDAGRHEGRGGRGGRGGGGRGNHRAPANDFLDDNAFPPLH